VAPAPQAASPPPLAPIAPALSPTTLTSTTARRFAAKLKLERASIHEGRLDVLLSITGRATGPIELEYRAAGRRSAYTVDAGPPRVGEKHVRIVRRLEGAQRSRRTGIVAVAYRGDARVQPDGLRSRAANERSLLRRTLLSFADGRLRVSGTLDADVSGAVALRARYTRADGTLATWRHDAPVREGRWSADVRAPAAVAADPEAYLSIAFTGDLNARGGPYRGEQDGTVIGGPARRLSSPRASAFVHDERRP